MLTPDSRGTGTPAICRKSSPDGQSKAEQKLSPKNDDDDDDDCR
jgi:hypothetical protein